MSTFDDYRKRAERIRRLELLYQAVQELFALASKNIDTAPAMLRVKQATLNVEKGVLSVPPNELN